MVLLAWVGLRHVANCCIGSLVWPADLPRMPSYPGGEKNTASATEVTEAVLDATHLLSNQGCWGGFTSRP